MHAPVQANKQVHLSHVPLSILSDQSMRNLAKIQLLHITYKHHRHGHLEKIRLPSNHKGGITKSTTEKYFFPEAYEQQSIVLKVFFHLFISLTPFSYPLFTSSLYIILLSFHPAPCCSWNVAIRNGPTQSFDHLSPSITRTFMK